MPTIGIDLGTTLSLVSVMQAGQPVILANALGERMTPSAVSVRETGDVLVGAAARARVTTHPADTAVTFKRDMGTDTQVILRGREFTPQELSALVLKQLKEDAEAALGEPVDEAVVTVPAYFGEQQRQATRDAGTIAGLRVERIINEPTAAALAYGLHHLQREIQAVVLDLGGGTFDVTVLEIIEGVIEIQASAGDAHLGGEDFTDAMAARLSTDLRAAGLPVDTGSRGFARLREACDHAKRRLTSDTATRIALPELPLSDGRTIDVERELERIDVESGWLPLLQRIEAPIRRALSDAQLAPGAVDEVILVGGATRMPCFVRLVAQLFGRMPQRHLPPDEAVAMGAAIQAALKDGDEQVEELVVTDIAPFTMGVEISTDIHGGFVSGLFSPIIERGTVIPCSRKARYATSTPGQTEIVVRVFQGEHPQCNHNRFLGELKVPGVPPAPAGMEAIDVRFTYDLNGLLEVEATLVSTGRTAAAIIEHTPGRMTAEEIEGARRSMARLKIVPRDLLPNRTLIERAEARYAEWTGRRRQALGLALSAFLSALESEDRTAIEQSRSPLAAMLSSTHGEEH